MCGTSQCRCSMGNSWQSGGPLLEGRGMLFRVTDHYSSTNLDLNPRKRLYYCHEPMIYTEHIPCRSKKCGFKSATQVAKGRGSQACSCEQQPESLLLLILLPYFPCAPFPTHILLFYFILCTIVSLIKLHFWNTTGYQ